MKKHAHPRFKNALLTASALFAAVAASYGQTWDGGGANDNWSTGANWNADVAPVNDGNADVIFAGSTRTSPIMDVDWAIKTLTFASGASAYNLGGDNLLSLGTNLIANTTVLINNSTAVQTINSNIVVGSGNTGNSTTYTLNGGGGLNLTGDVDAGLFRINLTGTAGSTITVSGNISGARVGSPTSNSASNQTLSMGTEGVTYILSGNNTFTGNVYNQRGTVLLRSNTALGQAPNVTLGADNNTSSPTMLIDGAYTIDRNFYVASSSGTAAGTVITVGGNTADTSTFSGNFQLGNNLDNGGGKNLNVTAVDGGTVNFSGNLTTFNSDGKDSITKIGNGTVVISGTGNTYSGSTSVTAGTLLINSAYAASGAAISVSANARLGGLATIDRAISVSSGGILQGGDGTTGSTLSVNSNVTLGNGSVISLALGSAGSHSTLARLGGSWTFDLVDQAFLFTDLGATTGTYRDLLTGLSLDPGVAGWTILNEGWEGTFSYSGGNVSLNLTAVPEPSIVALAGLGLGFLLLRVRRKILA